MPHNRLVLESNLSKVCLLLLLLVGLTVFFIGLFPIRDGGDQWWHLKTGKYLLDVRFDFPEEDVFSWTSTGHYWANHEWLADTLMYLAYEAVGLRGLIVIKALILVGTFFLVAGLIYRRTGNLLLAVAGMLLAGWASQYSVHLRPPILTYFMTALYLHLALNLERGNRIKLNQALSFPLMVLWINLHGGAILALVISGLYFGGAILSWLSARLTSQPESDLSLKMTLIRRWGLNLLILLVASLCNPFTYHIHLLTYKVMSNPYLISFISELQIPNIHHTKGYLTLLVITILLGLASIRRARPADALLVLFFFHQSIQHVRHLPLFAIIVTPILFETIGVWYGGLFQSEHKQIRIVARGITLLTVALVLLGSGYLLHTRWRMNVRPFLNSPGYLRHGTPADAVEFLRRFPFEGPMYNPINFSGYLIWALSPEHYQTFTDSRFDIFGSEIMFDCLAIESANTLSPEEYGLPIMHQEILRWQVERGERPPYWMKALDRYEINFMILGRDSRLHLLLSTATQLGWVKIYEDAGYAIYVRDNPKNSALIESARRTYQAIQDSRMR